MASAPLSDPAAAPGAAHHEADVALVGRLAEELRLRWEQGERPLAEDLLAQHPHLWQHPELALDLIYEELCQRQRAGLPAPATSILRRFPQWRQPIEVLLDCHRLLEPTTPATATFPGVGEHLGDFVLTAELGRGATGRVFLARQTSLGDRLVVLKLLACDQQEHLCLARLQHTHVVPLHAAHVDPARHLRVLCMPWFGGASLESLLEALALVPASRRHGGDLVAALDRLGLPAGDGLPPGSRPIRALFARLSWVEAVCFIGACLADALEHAHSRGLVHLDVKPSNVLIAGDGQPMLLDFHLARAPLAAGSVVADLGGTVSYMAPEQCSAVLAVSRGQPLPCAVDHRADIFGLGLLLYRALGGSVAPGPGTRPRLDRLDSSVSVSLADLIEKCLHDDPARRPSRAADLAADLRRHLQDLPLRLVPNRSYSERWARWRRRRPAALGGLLLAVALSLALVSVLALLAVNYHHRIEEAQNASRLREERDRARLAEAEANRQHLVRQLHDLANGLRGLSGLRPAPQAAQALLARCGALWQRRHDIVRDLDLRNNPAAAADFLDIMLIWLDGPPVGARAGEVLDELETLLGASAALEQERARRAGLTRDTDPRIAGHARVGIVPRLPRTAWEHVAVARSLLAQDRIEEALAGLETARRLDPGNHWVHFLLGQGALRQGRPQEAVAAFSVCIGADPTSAVHPFNRALAWQALGQARRARADLDDALRLDPHFSPAWLQRGLVSLDEKAWKEAANDLHRALETGGPAATVHYHLARTRFLQGDARTARHHLEQALAHDPEHEPARLMLEGLR